MSCFGRIPSAFFLSALLVLLIGCPPLPPPPSLVAVPDLSGMTQAEATAALANANLSVGIVTMESSAEVPAGQIIRQDPLFGAKIEAGTEVSLVLSAGFDSVVATPNLIGMTQADALVALTNTGLTAGMIKQEFSATVPAGYVMGQSPVFGVNVLPGSSVALVISAGSHPVTVPDMVGVAQIYAEAAIHNMGLVVGTIIREYNPNVTAGSVLRQTPIAGSTVAPGATVDLVVSVSEPGNVPNVIGMTLKTARTAITNAGLTVGTVTQAYHPQIPEGEIIDQNPTAASVVPNGSSVNLVLATHNVPQPELSVTPSLQVVSTAAGTTTFEVSNTGTGTMNWTAMVTSGGNWLRITSGISGVNSGTITITYNTNTSMHARAATIQVTIAGSTALVNVQQAGTAS